MYISYKVSKGNSKNQDIPVQSWRVIYNKLERSRLSEDSSLLDCLPNNPVWKTNEDNIYYLNQKQNLGGYCTPKEVSYNIHPCKQPRRYDQFPEAAQIHEHAKEVEEDCDSDADDDDSEPNFDPSGSLRTMSDVSFAVTKRKS